MGNTFAPKGLGAHPTAFKLANDAYDSRATVDVSSTAMSLPQCADLRPAGFKNFWKDSAANYCRSDCSLWWTKCAAFEIRLQ